MRRKDNGNQSYQQSIQTVKKKGLKLSARTELVEQNPLPSGKAGPVIRTQPTKGRFMSEKYWGEERTGGEAGEREKEEEGAIRTSHG